MPNSNRGGSSEDHAKGGRASNGGKGKGGGQGGSGGGGNRGEAARKGGEAVSQDREHMSEIGRKGGKK